MPFKSEAQRGWMYSTHPKMAKEWEKETPEGKLPKKKAKSKKKEPRKGIGGSEIPGDMPGK